jgi:transcription initiation factor TFIIIB Brf1 subunit/transcription initiation factor TFIIB
MNCDHSQDEGALNAIKMEALTATKADVYTLFQKERKSIDVIAALKKTDRKSIESTSIFINKNNSAKHKHPNPRVKMNLICWLFRMFIGYN